MHHIFFILMALLAVFQDYLLYSFKLLVALQPFLVPEEVGGK